MTKELLAPTFSGVNGSEFVKYPIKILKAAITPSCRKVEVSGMLPSKLLKSVVKKIRIRKTLTLTII